MEIKEAASKFLASCQSERNLSPHTLRAYRGDLEDARRFLEANGTLGIAAVNSDGLRRYLGSLEARSLAPATRRRRAACLRSFFKWLERRKLVVSSPLRDLDLALRVPRALARNLQREEVRSLVRVFTDSLRLDPSRPYGDQHLPRCSRAGERIDLSMLVAIEILLATGVRVGELTRLQVNAIDVDEGTLTINGKGARERRVFLVDATLRVLVRHYLTQREGWANGTPAFLLNSSGRRASSQFVRRHLAKATHEALLSRRATPHMLRHSCATLLIEAGVDIRFVQNLLGHSSIATTERYTHVTATSLRKVLGAVNLRKALFRSNEE